MKQRNDSQSHTIKLSSELPLSSPPKAIRIERRGEEPFELPLYPDAEYTFGRDRSCTVVFADESVSRDHGLLTCRADGCWVYRDRGSSNGSFIADHTETEAEIEDVTRINAGRPYRVAVGQSIVLANSVARIAFLAEPAKHSPDDAAQRSPRTLELENDIQRNARHRMPVFLLGPTGSGKTWAARRIHELSKVGGNFVLVDCGSLSRELNSLRSELLGHVRGAYSGAGEPRLGKLYHAEGGTLFLDEVESLSIEGQGLLLNLIDGTGDFTPLGQAANVDMKRPRFRLISASKLPLRQSGLREDLCNRLGRGGIVILPTLEERQADIPALVRQLTSALNQELQLDVRFEPSATKLLQSAAWPGHVRELEGVVRTVVELECADKASESLAQTGVFKAVQGKLTPVIPEPQRLVIGVASVRRHLEQHQRALGHAPSLKVVPMSPVVPAQTAGKRPQHYSRDELKVALDHQAHNVTRTAKALGMATNTLKKLIRQHQIDRP